MPTNDEIALIAAFRQMPDSAKQMIFHLAISYAATNLARTALEKEFCGSLFSTGEVH